MKLTNFYEFEVLNQLKERMGIPREQYGSFTVVVSGPRLTPDELERLVSPDGLDIDSLDDLRVLDDGTLGFKDSRVLLYIRDVTAFKDKPFEPKFHVAHCKTLRQMREMNRLNSRYVVATRVNGEFNLNVSRYGTTTRSVVRLSVCQNCLDWLQFEGFEKTLSRPKRKEIVRGFEISRFFDKFPKSLHIARPVHTSDSAPLNDYVVGFADISLKARSAAGWCCQECGLNLSKQDHRRFLHAHHRNGDKSDNTQSNLKVVCMGCHANEPCHAHMKNLPEYAQFVKVKRSLS